MGASPGNAANSVHYSVDKRASQFTVQAFASGLISAIAHSPKIAIRDWTCDAVFEPGSFKSAFLKARVKADSLEVLDELRDSDRRELHRVMNREVLETARFPEVTFESTRIIADKLKEDQYRVNISGELTLHGVTNQLEFAADVAFGHDTVRAHGGFTLLQSDYEIRIASIAGGSLKLQDELKFTFFVVARKQT
jgi:polyisoprenoid-binding protein YceI